MAARDILMGGAIGLAVAGFAGARRTATPMPAAPAAHSPAVAAAAPSPAAPLGNGLADIRLQRAPDSHFYADAQVNGARVRFIVDTGSTSLVLTRADAQRAGVAFGDYSARGTGAGGEIRLMPVSLDRVAIGPLAAVNVPAMVAESGLPVSLMGESYLSRIGSVAISGDMMTLR